MTSAPGGGRYGGPCEPERSKAFESSQPEVTAPSWERLGWRWVAWLLVAVTMAWATSAAGAARAEAGSTAGSRTFVPDGATRVETVEFCADTPQPFDAQGCQWQTVTLPHRWVPATSGPAWGLYRATVPHHGQPVTGILTTQLSLNGRVRVGTQTVIPAAAVDDDLAHLRYWPQLYTVATPEIDGGDPMHIEIAVRGHGRAKNGLGTLIVAAPSIAQDLHTRSTLHEALAMLAMAAATAMAGGLGLAARAEQTPAGRLLRVVSWIALLASARMAANFVTQPPVPVAVWTLVNLMLLATVAAAVCLTIAIYLHPLRRGLRRWALAALALLAVGLAVLPAPLMYPWAEVWFMATALLGAMLFLRLLAHVIRARDALGWIVAGPVLGMCILGTNDLLLHLGERSMSGGYLQRWSVPGLLILMITLLTRRLAAQNRTEAALALETRRREELLRDLHDGIGSRLVALLFHVRRADPATPLGHEIEAMQRELQLIQGAVRAVPTTLNALIADLRHLYTRVGGGALPIDWQVCEPVHPVLLTAQQAMATVRVFEEAVANAVKHAQPRRITVSLSCDPGPWQAVLSIHDDGVGSFVPDRGRGLENMKWRSERAGLCLQLAATEGGSAGKAVMLMFPAQGQQKRRSLWQRIRQP